jgi:hypothetical protein
MVRPLRRVSRVLWQAVDNVMIDGGLTKVGPFLVGFFGCDGAAGFQNGDVQRYIIAVIVGTAASVLFGSTYWLAHRRHRWARSQSKSARVTLEAR